MRYFSRLLRKLARTKEAIIFSPTFEISLLVRDKICAHRKLKVTGVFNDFGACMEAINQRPPAIVFYEIDADGFRDLAREVLEDFPKIRLVGISIVPVIPVRILTMHTAGVRGYMNLLSETRDILFVFDQTIAGEDASTHDNDRKIPFLQHHPSPKAIVDEYRRVAIEHDKNNKP